MNYEPPSDPPAAHRRLRRPTKKTSRISVAFVAAAAAAGVGYLVVVPGQSPVEAAAVGYTGISVTSDGSGYGLVADAGETYAFGSVQYQAENPHGFDGSITDISVTGDGQGYVEVSTRGQVYAYGNAQAFGNPEGFGGDIAGIAVTADGGGYAVVSSEGQIYAYGSVRAVDENPAGFDGGIADIAVTADGQGLAVVSGAGQVYAYGTATYFENPAGFTGSIEDIALTADGQGYAAVSTEGQLYAYGSVVPQENPTGFTGGIIGLSVTGDGQGMAVLSGTGQVYAYGSVVHLGNGDPGIIDGPALPREITRIAEQEAANAEHNKEVGGADCNFYTPPDAPGGHACGDQGWFAEAWCADFARWVWAQAGVDVAGLDAGAVSFKNYGVERGTWREGPDPALAQVGDAVFFDRPAPTQDHVGLVIAVHDDGTIDMISGNYDQQVLEHNFDPVNPSDPNDLVAGYASPVS